MKYDDLIDDASERRLHGQEPIVEQPVEEPQAAEDVYTPEVGVSRHEAIAASKESLDFFAELSIPDVFMFGFPQFFQAVWQMFKEAALTTHGRQRFAIGIPRGFAKTLFLKLFTVWLILFTDRKFILVVCNTEPHAKNFIADVMDIMSSLNILRVFGNWKLTEESDTQVLKKFSFKGRPVILAGLGNNGSPRGFNIKLVRPDVIIMDDMQSKEEAGSATEADRVLQWMLGTLMKAADPFRCLYIFVGNMYPFEGTILRKLKTNPAWVSFVTGAILEDGESLWPDLRTVEDILLELENDESMGHPEIFYAEVMNDEVAGSRAGIDITKINTWTDQHPGDDLADAGFVIIDPSLGKKKSDAVAIGACLIFDGEPMLRDVARDKQGGMKFNPMQCVVESLKLAAKYNLSCIVVEAVAYQESLCFWMDHVMRQQGITGFKILTINPRGLAKNGRIIQMLKMLTAEKNRVWVHKTIKTLISHQITYFDPTKIKNKDDLLDIMAYFYQVIIEYKYQLLRTLDISALEVEAAGEEELADQLDF